MQRKTTLATAAAVTLVLLAGSAAAATNLGLLDAARDSGTVGSLTQDDATATPSRPDTVIVEPAMQPRTSVDQGTPAGGQPESDDDVYESDDDAYESDDDVYESDDDAYESDEDHSSDDEDEEEGHERYEAHRDDD